MIDPLFAPAVPTTQDLFGTRTGGSAEIGKDEFLKLLVAQLQNQNPLDPSSSEQFAAQLAQFSALEQLVNVNATLEAQLVSNTAVVDAVIASSAMNLAGREVLVAGNTLTVNASGESTPLTIGVAAPGGEATLKIFNDAGVVVAEVSLGPIRGGRQSVDVSAHVSGLEEGRYTYEVTVLSEDGTPLDVQPLYRMRVEAVRFGPNGPTVSDGVREYSIADLLEIISGP